MVVLPNIIQVSDSRYCVVDGAHLHFLRGVKTTAEVDDFCRRCPQRVDDAGGGSRAVGRLSLFVTKRCNLRCVYCYADAGSETGDASVERACAAIKFIAGSADEVILDYHGGGEPTLRFDFVTETFDYARSLGRPVVVFFITNGTDSSPRVVRWITENVSVLCLSLDGPQEIHDALRPCLGGEGSYQRVVRFVQAMVEANKAFTARATITAANVTRMLEIIKHFKSLGIRRTIFEPCFNHGRTKDINVRPDPRTYAENFMEAFRFAHSEGLVLRTSAFRMPGTDYYCGTASGRNICLTVDGWLSSCYEVVSPTDEAGKDFFIGRIEGQKVYLFEDRVKRLRTLRPALYPSCGTCQYQPLCRGCCPIKNYREAGFAGVSWHLCEVSKALFPPMLEYLCEHPDACYNLWYNVSVESPFSGPSVGCGEARPQVGT